MRPTRSILAAGLLAIAVAAPAAAVVPGGAAEETVAGVLEAVQVDIPGDATERFEYTIRSGHAITRVGFAAGNPRSLVGSTVAARGHRDRGTLRVRTASEGRDLSVRARRQAAPLGAWAAQTGAGELHGGSGPQTAEVTAAATKSIAVVMFNFSNLRTTPYTKAQLQDVLLNSSTSLKRFYEEESKGRLTITGQVYGWYQIADSTADCDWQTWHGQAWDAATAAGVNLSSFTHVMFVFPHASSCTWAGLGYVPGPYSYINGTLSVQVMTHEVGHNFGLSHANAANCTVGGTRVTIAATSACAAVGYADPFSTMGNNALRHNHGSHLGELGWLDPGEKVIAVPGNTYTITPYFGPAGLKLVRVPRGDGSFFDLDLRMPYGLFDAFTASSPAATGVTIRLGKGTASPTHAPQATLLLDSTPGTTDLKDAPLAVGRTMTDPVSGISISALSVGPAGIVVQVRESVAPSAPTNPVANPSASAVALSWGAASDNIAVAGYRVSRDGTLLATTAAGATSHTDGAPTSGATHTYAIAAVDTSGNVGPAATVQATVPVGGGGPTPTPTPTPAPDPTPTPGPAEPPVDDSTAPTAPDPLSGSPTTTTVSLTWGASTDDTGVVGYRVTRNGALVASPTGTSWKDTARKPRTAYTYTVAALDGVGNVSSTASVTVTTLADTQRPSTPKGFRRVARAAARVTFDWSPSVDNVGVTKYVVYRVGRAAPVATTRVSRIRIKTVRGARYYVRAVDLAGNRSAASSRSFGRR